jgi:cyclic-di-GMP-binding protein
MVAVRDESDPRWCIAVVRWIRQDSEGTSMGVELLSPRAIPVAARVINKKGGPTDYARVFLLPALEPIGQPATLVTPPLPFQPGQKINVLRQGVKTTAQLGECTLKTESFNQFTFRMLDGYLENTKLDSNMTV